MKFNSIVLVVFVLLFSCEKDIDMKIPDKGRKTVINSFITPDKPIEFLAFKSRYILDDANFERITDIQFLLFKNDVIIDTLQYSSISESYLSNIYPELGSTYSFQVNYNGLISSANTQIPYSIPFTIKDTSSFKTEHNELFKIKIQFNDPLSTANYYLINVFANNDPNQQGNSENSIFIQSNDPSYQNQYQGGIIFDDKLFNGKLQTMEFLTQKYDFWGNSGDSIDLKIELKSLSYEAYMYLLTTQKQMEQGDAMFSEPVMIYNNIKEGYGIFGGYSVSQNTLRIPVYIGGGMMN